MVFIGIMGDRQVGFEPHDTIEPALEHAARTLGLDVRVDWISTEWIGAGPRIALQEYDGLFAAPGSATDLDGACAGLRYARETDTVMIGTCAGFQHAILEFARNVAGIEGAAHEDYDPDGTKLVLTALVCSIAGRAMEVQIVPGTRAHDAYGTLVTTEEYYCNYGLNPAFEEVFAEHGLVFSARDADGDARIVELPQKRFFMASLFVPQTRSTPMAPHPLLCAFLRAAAKQSAAVPLASNR